MIIRNGLVVIGLDRMSSEYRHNNLPVSDLGVMEMVDRQQKMFSTQHSHNCV